MRGPSVQPIVIAAGGTGGHFFPAEALAEQLVARGHRIVLMTDRRSGGLSSPVFSGREQYVIRGAGIAGRGFMRAGKAVLGLAAGVAQARGILNRINPACVVGFGGYPSIGPVLGARLLRHRPSIILHEQNAVLGRANRFLAPRANVLALSFEATERLPPQARMRVTGNSMRPVVTGNPVRPIIEIFGKTGYVPPDDRITLLVLGGSLGARVFSDVVPAAMKALPDGMRARVTVMQQCRQEDLARVREAYRDFGMAAELSAFFPDVAARLAAAHLVIARAGASTIAELTVTGRPSILVPLPGAIDDHQSANARALAQAGGAWVIPQPQLDPVSLSGRLTALLADPSALAAAAKAAHSRARPEAARRLADLVEQHMHAGAAA